MDTGINVGSKNGSNLDKDTRVNIGSKIEIKSQSCDRGQIHVQVQFHRNEILSICQWIDINQVQGDVRKLYLG